MNLTSIFHQRRPRRGHRRTTIFYPIAQLVFCAQLLTVSHGLYWKLRIQLEDYLLQDSCFMSGCGQPSLKLILSTTKSTKPVPTNTESQASKLIISDSEQDSSLSRTIKQHSKSSEEKAAGKKPSMSRKPKSVVDEHHHPSEWSIGWPISIDKLALLATATKSVELTAASTKKLEGEQQENDHKRQNEIGHQPIWNSIFTAAEARNLTFMSEISGIDAKYSFPRSCDNTQTIYLSIRQHQYDTRSSILPTPGEQYVGVESVQGECFNTTIGYSWTCCGRDCPLDAPSECCESVRRHYSDGVGGLKTAQNAQNPEWAKGGIGIGGGDGGIGGVVPRWIALVLGGCAVLFFVATIILIMANWNQHRRNGNKASLSSGSINSMRKFPPSKTKYPSSHSHQSSRISRSNSEDSGKYDIPWDQKFRPLPDYVRSQISQQPPPHGMQLYSNGNGCALRLDGFAD